MSRVLNDKQRALAARMLPLLELGMTGRAIARELGVSEATVSRLRSRLLLESWLRAAYEDMQRRKHPADPSQAAAVRAQ